MSAVAPLGDLVDFYSGTGFPDRYQGQSEGEIPFAKVSDISRSIERGDAFIDSAANYVSFETSTALKAKPFPVGSIVFAKIGEAIRKNRRIVTSREMIFDNNVMGVSVRSAKVDKMYLLKYLNTIDFFPLSNTTAVPSLRKSVLADISVPLPSLDEQRRVVAVLNNVDGLRRQRKQSLKLIDRLAQSIYLDMFGDISRARSCPLDAITTEIYRYPTYYGIKYEAGGVAEVRGELIQDDGSIITNRADFRFISSDTASRFPKTKLDPGDLVMSVRGTIGKIGLVPEHLDGANITANLIRIAPDRSKIFPNYLFAALRSDRIKRDLIGATASTTIPTIKASDLKKLLISVPSLQSQQIFCDVIAKLERNLFCARKHSHALEAMLGAIQHRAFTVRA